MTQADELLADYGRNLGLPLLEFDPSGSVCLTFDGAGDLYIERLEEGLLIYLVRQYQLPNSEVLSQALVACHWDRNHPFPVNAALHGDTGLLFSVALTDSGLDLPGMERAIAYLERLHEEVMEGAHA